MLPLVVHQNNQSDKYDPKLQTVNLLCPRARRAATLGLRPSAASHAPNALLAPYVGHPTWGVSTAKQALSPRCASRPAQPRRPVPRYGAVSGRYGPTRGRSPSTARRGGGISHREPSLRRVATAKRACHAATDAVKTRRSAEMRFSPMFAAREVPSNSPNFSQFR